ncbi:MAG: twin-arginine translocase TatA/TatE family subunit [Proteobacteria bacterium]|nr:twin-arginine translocase TatA/TatE family subunit [Candidatus Enterousia scatequi]
MRLGWAEILIIILLVVILFGHNKIPGMMKNLADGIKIFKKEVAVKPADKKAVTKKAAAKKKTVSKK